MDWIQRYIKPYLFRLEASCPWIVHVSSMFRPWLILAGFEAVGKMSVENLEYDKFPIYLFLLITINQ